MEDKKNKTEKKTLVKKNESVIAKNVVVRVGRLETVDVAQFKAAVNAFKRGNRRLLYDLFDNFDIDPFLYSVIGRMIDAVTNAEITFQIDGQNVEEIDDLIDTDEFEDFLAEIVKSVIFGKTVTECNFYPNFHIFAVPRKNIVITGLDKPLSERKKFIAFKESDTSGYDYTRDDHILECGKDDDLGAAHRALLGAIYKRNGFADWAQNVELFGQPHRTYKYHSHDTVTRDVLIENAANQGGSTVSVIPIEADFKLDAINNAGSHQAYKGFKDACNEEILIAFLRNIMTTLSGSSESQAKIHKETEEDVYRALRRFTQRKLNSWFVPLLIKRGYKAAGGWFSFPDAGENIPTNERVDMALKMRSAGLPVDEDYIFEISGVAKASTGGDDPKKEQKSADGKDAKPAAKEEKEKKPAPEEKKPDKKEEQKLSDDRNFMLKLWDKATSLFLNAPTRWSGAYLSFKENWTKRITGRIELADGYSINIDKLIKEAIKEAYGDKLGEQLINKKLFDITNDALQHGIDTSLSRDDVDEEFVKQFKENAAVFSAFKNHQQTKEIAALMYDEDGKLVPWHKFRKQALQISEKYNEDYLRTEYNTAVRSARMASNLKRYEKNLDLFPNLEYIESGASHQRESHLKWVGTVLPYHHEAWKWLMPPSEWNCDCSVRPTDKEVTGVPVKPSDFNNLFAGNPAETAEFVNTKETPYYKHTDEKLRDSVARLGKQYQQENEAAKNVYKGKSGGYLEIAKQQGVESAKNLETYKQMADNGGKYKLLTPINTESVKNPDAFNLASSVYSDAKHPITEIGKNAIQSSIRSANKQRVAEVIIRLDKEYPSKELYDGLKAALQKGRVDDLKTIILIRKGQKPLYLDVTKLIARFARNNVRR